MLKISILNFTESSSKPEGINKESIHLAILLTGNGNVWYNILV